VLDATFSPTEARVLTTGADGVARLWNVATDPSASSPLPLGTRVYHASFSPSGRLIVTIGEDQAARIWDPATGLMLGRPAVHRDRVTDAEFSPDERLFATASWDGSVVIREALTGVAVGPAITHRGGVDRASFSSDGRRLLTAGGGVDEEDYGEARLWDPVTEVLIAPPMGHAGRVQHACFAADGQLAITATLLSAQIWLTGNGEPVSPPLRHPAMILQVGFSPDRHHFATTATDGRVRVFDLSPNPQSAEDLELLARLLASSVPTRPHEAGNWTDDRIWQFLRSKGIASLIAPPQAGLEARERRLDGR
jgi:WD40 repeat protein